MGLQCIAIVGPQSKPNRWWPNYNFFVRNILGQTKRHRRNPVRRIHKTCENPAASSSSTGPPAAQRKSLPTWRRSSSSSSFRQTLVTSWRSILITTLLPFLPPGFSFASSFLCVCVCVFVCVNTVRLCICMQFYVCILSTCNKKKKSNFITSGTYYFWIFVYAPV